jgi:hypothetical protein
MLSSEIGLSMMKDLQWASLAESVRTGSCVLVLGPDVSATPKTDSKESISVRDAFCHFLTEQLREAKLTVDETAMFALAQLYEDWPNLVDLKNVSANFFRNAPFNPGETHLQLALCPFSLILTTCHDNLFETALSVQQKSPSKYWYHYRGEQRDNLELDNRPNADAPIVYHLYGSFEKPPSLVLTENDLLEFITAIISGRPKLPDSLKSLLRNKTFLFVGFGIRHWYVRVLLKLLIRAIGISNSAFALESFAELDSRERQQTVLFYQRGTPRMVVVDMEELEFARELTQRLRDTGGYVRKTPQGLRRAQVFISYERSDREIAKRLFDALPKDRFEAWLDSDLLEAGQDWNQEIEERIKLSDYFFVLNSEALARKDVGYVNKEISLALDMQKYRQQGKRFIIPITIGDTTAANMLRPELQDYQQMPLRDITFDDDAKQLCKDVFRDYQKR